MKSCIRLFLIAVMASSWAIQAGSQTAPVNHQSALLGDWHGDSICQVKPSACHDEEALYHITRFEEKTGHYSMQADKIVQGKPEAMGTVECSFNESSHLLRCDFAKGYIELVVQGNQMQGSMKLTDGTLWRKISLKKVSP